MLVNREVRQYSENVRVWIGKYKNLTNLPHWHPDNEIIFAEKGNANVFIDGKNYFLGEKNSIFISPNCVHYIKAETGSILTFFLFEKDLSTKITDNKILESPLLSRDYNLGDLYKTINKELELSTTLSSKSVNNRIERLVIDIFTNEKSTEVVIKENYLLSRYKSLLVEINKHYAEYTIESAAKFTALSESYFSKFFKKMADMTFTQYLNLIRIEKAIDMIRNTDSTITNIAISCGFDTIRNFNRVFKGITGFSPRELPKTYDPINIHPTYNVENSFDPTSKDAELIDV